MITSLGSQVVHEDAQAVGYYGDDVPDPADVGGSLVGVLDRKPDEEDDDGPAEDDAEGREREPFHRCLAPSASISSASISYSMAASVLDVCMAVAQRLGDQPDGVLAVGDSFAHHQFGPGVQSSTYWVAPLPESWTSLTFITDLRERFVCPCHRRGDGTKGSTTFL